jgi:hypothetical protein
MCLAPPRRRTMTKYTEIDFDNPVHWKRQRRRPPPPLEGEILTPESEPRIHRVEIVHNHRSGHVPQLIIAGALLFLVLRFLPQLGIGLLIAVALMVAYPIVGIAFGVIVATLAIIAIRNHRSGRPF